ncbi:MAG: iron-sulfur cluster assembly accessory protein [Simkaniaceae bacterium]|nr:iron-sulfur cluster assembly accessory protein [Simkaniaceae bacterium]
MNSKIERDWTIEQILRSFPDKSQKLASALTRAGLACASCQAATWETLEAGMLGHGFEDEAIDSLLGELNAILKEQNDPTTINLTLSAACKLQEILKAENKLGWALRFGDKPGGCNGYEYTLGFSQKASAQDVVFHSHGVDIHVDKSMVGRLMGSEIDHEESLMGSGFKITNPNVQSSCACGSSHGH